MRYIFSCALFLFYFGSDNFAGAKEEINIAGQVITAEAIITKSIEYCSAETKKSYSKRFVHREGCLLYKEPVGPWQEIRFYLKTPPGDSTARYTLVMHNNYLLFGMRMCFAFAVLNNDGTVLIHKRHRWGVDPLNKRTGRYEFKDQTPSSLIGKTIHMWHMRCENPSFWKRNGIVIFGNDSSSWPEAPR